jgi:hypothetical protein
MTNGSDITQATPLLRKPLAFVAAVIVGASALTACGSTQPPSAAPSANTSSSLPAAAPNLQCTKASASLLSIPTDAGEPILAVPQPAGWTFTTEHNSARIRGVLTNSSLASHDFNPTAIVTLTDVSDESSSAEQALAIEQGGVAQTVGHLDAQVPGTVCGFPSATITFTTDGRQETELIVAARDDRNKVWVATVGVQSADADNADYVRDRQTIIDGFQMGLPTT